MVLWISFVFWLDCDVFWWFGWLQGTFVLLTIRPRDFFNILIWSNLLGLWMVVHCATLCHFSRDSFLSLAAFGEFWGGFVWFSWCLEWFVDGFPVLGLIRLCRFFLLGFLVFGCFGGFVKFPCKGRVGRWTWKHFGFGSDLLLKCSASTVHAQKIYRTSIHKFTIYNPLIAICNPCQVPTCIGFSDLWCRWVHSLAGPG